MKRLVLIIAIVLSFVAQNSYAVAPWWNSAYLSREEIIVANNTASSVDAIPVQVMLKPYNVIGDLTNGDDVRIVYYNGTSNAEIDRIYNYKSVLFKLQAAISANSRTSDKYWIYWKNPSATSPPANKANVFATTYDFASGITSWSDITWTSHTNTSATPTANDLKKTGGSAAWDADAISNEQIASAGTGKGIRFYCTSGITIVIGLTDSDTGADRAGIDYGLYCHSSGNLYAMENAVNMNTTYSCTGMTYTGTDILSIELNSSGYPVYKKNGTTLCTSTVSPSYPLFIDTSMYTVNDIISDVQMRSATEGDWTYYCDPGASVTNVSGTMQINMTATSGNRCTAYRTVATTTDAKRTYARFKLLDNVPYIRFGFTWGTNGVAEADTEWANGIQLYSLSAWKVHYNNSSGGSVTNNNSEQTQLENLVYGEWYSVTYEMLDHSIVGTVTRESTGNIIMSWVWGKQVYTEMDTENQWLGANLYFAVDSRSGGTAGGVQFDDVSIDTRKMPDVMPFFFKECGYKHDIFYDYAEDELYSALPNALYKSTNKCSSTSLVKDFATAYQTKVNNFSAEGQYPDLAGVYGNVRTTNSYSSTYKYHRARSLAITTTSTPGSTDNYYQLGNAGSLNGLTAGQQYTASTCVYVPSGQGINLSAAKIGIIDYDTGWNYTWSGNPSAFDTWECLSATRTLPAGATEVFVRLMFAQDVGSKTIYYDRIQVDSGASVASPVFFGANSKQPYSIFKRNSRLFISFTATPPIYSDDAGVTWSESALLFGGTDNAVGTSRVGRWGWTSNNDYIFVAQYGGDTNGDRIYRSSDNGATFTEAYFFNAGPRHMHMLQINPYDGDLWASVGDDYKKVFYIDSADLSDSLPFAGAVVHEVASADPANLGLAFKDAKAVFGADYAQVNKIKSTSDQSTWQVRLGQGGNFDLQTFDLSYHVASGILFAAEIMDPTYGNNRIPSIFCSFDDGITFQICYEEKKGATSWIDNIDSISVPREDSTRLYFSTQGDVLNITNSLYYVALRYDELNPQSINPGIENGINHNIMAEVFKWH